MNSETIGCLGGAHAQPERLGRAGADAPVRRVHAGVEGLAAGRVRRRQHGCRGRAGCYRTSRRMGFATARRGPKAPNTSPSVSRRSRRTRSTATPASRALACVMLHDTVVMLTDYLLAAECGVFAALLARRGADAAWSTVFAATSAASLLGGTVHGFFPSDAESARQSRPVDDHHAVRRGDRGGAGARRCWCRVGVEREHAR